MAPTTLPPQPGLERLDLIDLKSCCELVTPKMRMEMLSNDVPNAGMAWHTHLGRSGFAPQMGAAMSVRNGIES